MNDWAVGFLTTKVNIFGDESLRYVPFDFHHECRKMKFENVSKLVDQVMLDLNQFG